MKLGAQVVGLSKDVPTQPARFEELSLADHITHIQGDVRDKELVSEIVRASGVLKDRIVDPEAAARQQVSLDGQPALDRLQEP